MELINIIWFAVLFIILAGIFFASSGDHKKKYDYYIHFSAPSFKSPKFNRK